MVLPAPSGPTRPVTWPPLIVAVMRIESGGGLGCEPLAQSFDGDKGIGHGAVLVTRAPCLSRTATVTGMPWRRTIAGIVDDDANAVDQMRS